MNSSTRLSLLFDKYLQKKCSPQEVEELIALLQHDDAANTLNEPMKILWEELKRSEAVYHVDWNRMYNSLISRQERADILLKKATSNSFRKYYRAVGVMVLILATGFTYWFTFSRKYQNNKNIVPAVASLQPSLKNKKQVLHLPDGSTVVLNVSGKLNYPVAFNSKRRDVYLEGEAFFDIKHNASQPFYVHVGKIVVKVLGTAFNIKISPQQNIEVTVTRGKVQVLKNTKPLAILTASEQLSILGKSDDIIRKTVDTLPVIAWKPVEIFFDDITMEEAARHITERFNVQIEFTENTLKERRVTATFSNNDSIDEILAVICAVSKSTYAISDNKIIIDAKNAK